MTAKTTKLPEPAAMIFRICEDGEPKGFPHYSAEQVEAVVQAVREEIRAAIEALPLPACDCQPVLVQDQFMAASHCIWAAHSPGQLIALRTAASRLAGGEVEDPIQDRIAIRAAPTQEPAVYRPTRAECEAAASRLSSVTAPAPATQEQGLREAEGG